MVLDPGVADDAVEREEMKTWQKLHGELVREYASENLTLHLYLQEMDLRSKAADRVVDPFPASLCMAPRGLSLSMCF